MANHNTSEFESSLLLVGESTTTTTTTAKNNIPSSKQQQYYDKNDAKCSIAGKVEPTIYDAVKAGYVTLNSFF